MLRQNLTFLWTFLTDVILAVIDRYVFESPATVEFFLRADLYSPSAVPCG
jgi:hypothetical protein